MIRTPEVDTYGPYARASLIADYVELLALKGPVRRAVVADFLADAGWNLALIQPSEWGAGDSEEQGLSEAVDEAREVASIVFDQMAERNRGLRGRYPFEITGDSVSCDTGINRENNAYLAMLSLTVAHAFDVDSAHRPDEVFEHTVTALMRQRGVASVGFGSLRRRAGTFERALRCACSELGLKAVPAAAAKSTRAYDKGVDVLGHMTWEDDVRFSSWVFLGQVTVGRSDTWETKIKEPSSRTWSRFVGIRNEPMRFLAVPHHVERNTMDMLASDGDALVLDRIRLASFKRGVDTKEREIIRAVTAARVEPLTG